MTASDDGHARRTCQTNGCDEPATHTERVDTGESAGNIPFCDEHGLANGGSL